MVMIIKYIDYRASVVTSTPHFKRDTITSAVLITYTDVLNIFYKIKNCLRKLGHSSKPLSFVEASPSRVAARER